MIKQRTIILFLALWMIAAGRVSGAVRKSVISGNWSNAATWGGVVPAFNDEVIIARGTTVSLNQTTVNYLAGLTIENGAGLLLTVNNAGLHISGDIVNNGQFILWNSNAQKGTLFLHGNSAWSGSGTWSLGAISLGDFALEFDDQMMIGIAGTVTGTGLSSMNTTGRRTNTLLVFNGTENASIPSNGNYCYPSISVKKNGPGTRTLSFTDQPAENTITLAGQLHLETTDDRLAIGSMNQLTLDKPVSGNGTISGGQDASLKVTGSWSPDDTLKLTAGTSLADLKVSAPTGLILQNSFLVRNKLQIDGGCSLTLPSNATLTVGVNGANPSKGEISGDGYLNAGAFSELTLRGNSANTAQLKFGQSDPSKYTLTGLTLSRIRNAGKIKLCPLTVLVLNGALTIDTANNLDIAGASLYLNLTITIRPEGYLTGSDQANLFIQGTGGNATLRFNPNGPVSNSTLESLYLNRTSGRIITLASPVYIRNHLQVVSGKISSNGNLVLLSDASGNASIDHLPDAADITGDVVVQSFFTGGPGMRGTRMLSAPVDDSGTNSSVYQQLQQQVLITGPGGSQNGFDPGGNAQPYAITIQTYNETATTLQPQFLPLPNIVERASSGSYPGKGKGFFLFYRGNRDQSAKKLNAINGSYAIPENTTVEYKGPVNKRDITVALAYTNNPGDNYNGYNVVGNPYPAAIDWTMVSRLNASDRISIIKPGGAMATYSNGVAINGTGLPVIQTGQAFYVKANGPGASITFTESSKTATGVPGRFLLTPGGKNVKTSVFGGPGQSTDTSGNTSILKIRLTEEGSSEETAIVMNRESRTGYDELDALYFPGNTTTLASLSSDGIPLAINFIPEPLDSSIIKLNFIPSFSGSADFTFSQVPAGRYEIQVQDNWLGTKKSITDTISYKIKVDKAVQASYGSSRFEMLILKKTGVTTGSGKTSPVTAYPNPVTGILHISLAAPWNGKEIKMQIYDSQGRKVVEGRNLNEDLTFLPPGMYSARISTISGEMIGDKRFIKNE